MFIVIARGQGPGADQEAAGDAARGVQERWPRENNDDKIDETKEYAKQRLAELKKNLAKLEKDIIDHLKTERTIGPGGRNIFEEQYINLGNTLAQKQMRIGELSQQLMIAQSRFPRPTSARPSRIARAADRACSSSEKKKLDPMLLHEGQANGQALR